jgi:TRAP-type C4-dicarboxylate transport system permease small subunit
MVVSGDFEAHSRELPAVWQRIDHCLLHATEVVAAAVGMLFTVLVTTEVASRYLFNFSIFFVSSSAIFLMVWFFMLGAGLALRQGAHVGFELLSSSLPLSLARACFFIGQGLTFFFFLAMFWSGVRTIGPAARQMEGALGISLMWVMLAFPVGFFLLIYNQIVIFIATTRRWPKENKAS